MSSDHYALYSALSSPKMIVVWNFEQIILLKKSCKPNTNDSNSEVLWLGDIYIAATYYCDFIN